MENHLLERVEKKGDEIDMPKIHQKIIKQSGGPLFGYIFDGAL
jgi:hypothetical protein